jgi:hypothetical protein
VEMLRAVRAATQLGRAVDQGHASSVCRRQDTRSSRTSSAVAGTSRT